MRLINDNADTLKLLNSPPLGVLLNAKPLKLDTLVMEGLEGPHTVQLDAVRVSFEHCWKQLSSDFSCFAIPSSKLVSLTKTK